MVRAWRRKRAKASSAVLPWRSIKIPLACSITARRPFISAAQLEQRLEI
jgi:hypothetical protein